MRNLISDFIVALESAETWLEKGYRVKIQPWTSGYGNVYIKSIVYDNNLPIVVSLVMDGETLPGIVNT